MVFDIYIKFFAVAETLLSLKWDDFLESMAVLFAWRNSHQYLSYKTA